MAFIIKKKRYKFQVELTLNELTEVSFGKAILFAKVRQLDGGNFIQSSAREEVENHAVKYDTKFSFPCKMAANSTTGVLDSCKCRVSIRKEEKGGKNYRKIGFVDIDLAEYAGAGPSTQRYILQAYDQNHRLDNSLLQITLNITLREGDLVFQRPLTRAQPINLPGEEEGSVRVSDLATTPGDLRTTHLTLSDVVGADEDGHTRNSSTTSHQTSSSHGAHSRQSSGDSGQSTSNITSETTSGMFGSLEKEKRRKKLDSGRVDAEDVINELMEDMKLDSVESAGESGGGLQLYLAPDGSVRFDQPNNLDSEFQEVVIGDR